MSSTRSWANAVLNKNIVEADACVNNLNTSEEEQRKPVVVSDDEDDPEVVVEVPVVKKKVSFLPDADNGRALKVVNDGATKLETKSAKKKKTNKSIDVNQAHDQWGRHQNLRTLKTMAHILGYKLVGDLVPCDSCRLVKARRASVLRCQRQR